MPKSSPTQIANSHTKKLNYSKNTFSIHRLFRITSAFKEVCCKQWQWYEQC